MGQVGFLVPHAECLPAEATERAYMAGLDDLPWETRVATTADGLSVERSEGDSGYFHILWSVPGRGLQVLVTSTIRERETPYNLAVELARGALNRLRNQIAGWDMAGLTPPSAVGEQLQKAMHEFAGAATNQQQPAKSAERAQQAIEFTLSGSDLLAAAFAEHAIRLRKSQSAKLTMLFGARLGAKLPDAGQSKQLAAAFNSAIVPLSWNEIESREGKWQWALSDAQLAWCAANELRIVGGPVLDLDREGSARLAVSLGRGLRQHHRNGHAADSSRGGALQGPDQPVALRRWDQYRRYVGTFRRAGPQAGGAQYRAVRNADPKARRCWCRSINPGGEYLRREER